MLDEQEAGDEAAAAGTRAEARRIAGELGATPAEVDDHLAMLPERYAAVTSPRAVVRHALMCRSVPDDTELRTRVRPGEGAPDGPAVDELDVVADDHPGWFVTVAGVVALHGGSVVAADAFTRADGLAVDTFVVQPLDGAAGSWWARVEGDLSDAAAGRLAVRARVARMVRDHAPGAERRGEIPTRVATATDASGTATVVEVRTLDRLGVLYSVATAFAELRLDLVVARVTTVAAEVVDVFHVRDPRGRPLDDDHAAELELAVRSALDGW